MNRKLSLMVLVLGMMALIGGHLAVAQEEQAMQDEQGTEDVYEFTFGKITKIGNNQVTIMEYNFEAEKEAEATYEVTSSTEMMNVDALSSLHTGDEIEIEFKDENGKRTAMSLAKDEGESMDDMDAQDMMMESDDMMNATQEQAQ